MIGPGPQPLVPDADWQAGVSPDRKVYLDGEPQPTACAAKVEGGWVAYWNDEDAFMPYRLARGVVEIRPANDA